MRKLIEFWNHADELINKLDENEVLLRGLEERIQRNKVNNWMLCRRGRTWLRYTIWNYIWLVWPSGMFSILVQMGGRL